MTGRPRDRVERPGASPGSAGGTARPRTARRRADRVRAALLAVMVAASIAAAARQVPDWPSERPPRPLPAREVRFPPYELRTLPNGLQVVA
ncbi:MAG TPA: hypothetical protein VNI83_14950, partial [Vicinamibacterales bacterium]|nr:hypothetical protein [Vicinamibacterales bacterium]